MSIIDRLLKKNIIDEDAETNKPLASKRMKGRILKVHSDGYGFITSKELPFIRIFFHWTALTPDTLNFKELHDGMLVEFTPMKTQDKGMRAIKVRIEEDAEYEEDDADRGRNAS